MAADGRMRTGILLAGAVILSPPLLRYTRLVPESLIAVYYGIGEPLGLAGGLLMLGLPPLLLAGADLLNGDRLLAAGVVLVALPSLFSLLSGRGLGVLTPISGWLYLLGLLLSAGTVATGTTLGGLVSREAEGSDDTTGSGAEDSTAPVVTDDPGDGELSDKAVRDRIQDELDRRPKTAGELAEAVGVEENRIAENLEHLASVDVVEERETDSGTVWAHV